MPDNIHEIADNNLDDLIETINNCRIEIAKGIVKSSEAIGRSIKGGRKVLICGNGGSAAQSQHIVAEFVVRLRSTLNRKAYPAIALTTDTSVLTSCANDFGFEEVFSRQIDALGEKGDILIVMSTSGNSANILKAAIQASKKEMLVIGVLGGDGGRLRELADIPIIVPSSNTQRIQEIHINIGHSIVEGVEEILIAK